MSYDNTNRGQIWKNDKKETENHPDFKGSINVEGVEYWVSGWKRKPDANPKAPALSFSIQAKEQQQNYGNNTQQSGGFTKDPAFTDIPEDDYDFSELEIVDLEEMLEEAVKKEEYEKASKIRDELNQRNG